jgi:hypothetical protein
MSFRKLVFWIHLAVGCLAGAIILIMSVTGVLLMYQRQVTNWFDRDLRAASPRAGSGRLPMETVLAGIYSQKGYAIGDHSSRRSCRTGGGELWSQPGILCRSLHGQRAWRRFAGNPIFLSNGGRLASMAWGEQ